MTASDRATTSDAATELLHRFGIHARPLRRLIAMLTEQPHTLSDLIRVSAVPRRTVEQLLYALSDDIDRYQDSYQIYPDRRQIYRNLIDYDRLIQTEVADPLTEKLNANGDVLAALERYISRAPAAQEAFDHVQATPETVVRRALWLEGTFDIAKSHILCLGDHDLTSLAIALINPATSLTVVDIDERTLAYIDNVATALDLDIRCLFADLRFGLPTAATQSADLVFTDPPYTPEGVHLFLLRALQALRDETDGRLIMAYGFSELNPTLGLKAQESIGDLHLVYEAVFPHFNRYFGAQAVGSSSQLYVCRPTSTTWKSLDRVLKSTSRIYTRGPQALEGAHDDLDPTLAQSVLDALTADSGSLKPIAVVGPGWPPQAGEIRRLELAALLTEGKRVGSSSATAGGVAVNLAGDPGPWLIRTLLAVNAPSVVALVPNNHPDIASKATQDELVALIGSKYKLRFRRSTPDRQHAMVHADAVHVDTAEPSKLVANWMLSRAHGKIANIWREALISTCRASDGRSLTKNRAREIVRAHSRRSPLLDSSLVELPRHQLRELLEDVDRSVYGLADPDPN